MNKKKGEIKNMAASVRDRLKKITDESGQDYNTLLTRYAIERLLFRLSKSKHKKRFVLKGAILFALWHETPHHVTRDLDLLGFGESSTGELKKVFGEICSQAVPEDGVIFDPASVKAEPIRAQDSYAGVRVGIQGKSGTQESLFRLMWALAMPRPLSRWMWNFRVSWTCLLPKCAPTGWKPRLLKSTRRQSLSAF